MIKNQSRIIEITAYNVSTTVPETVFSAQFRCGNCKRLTVCPGVENCAFVKYIQERVGNTTLKYNVAQPSLNIILPNEFSAGQVLRIIKRAKRLRTFKPLLRCR